MLSFRSRFIPSGRKLKAFRIVMHTLLYLVHFTLLGLLWASIFTTGSTLEVVTMAIEWLALITLILYAAFVQFYNFNLLLERQFAIAWLASLTAFIICGIFSLGNAIAFSVRAGAIDFCRDFKGIAKNDYCLVSNIVLGLSWLSVFLCILGGFARYLDWEGFDRAQTPSAEHYYVHQSFEDQSGESGIQTSPRAVTHKTSYRVPPPPPSPTRTIEYCLHEKSRNVAATTPSSSASSKANARKANGWPMPPV